MNDLLLNPLTKRQLEQFIESPAQSLILAGPTGSGKTSLASYLAKNVLAADDFDSYPYKLVLSDENGKAIGIEVVRQLEHFLSLKVPRQAAYNRAVIVENAHKLSVEAQNALLKTLEEPPSGTILILNTNHEQALLPTVRSRSQALVVQRPKQAATLEFFQSKNYEPKFIKQAYAISGGLPGLMTALLADEEHPLLLATNKARQLLQSTAYERLLLVDELAKNRNLALDTAFILQQMAHVSLQTAEGAAARKWQAVLKAGYDASEAILQNAQPKLAVTNLCLSL